jgi:hypothetical protein
VRLELDALGFSEGDFDIVLLDKPTRGQAETVALGLKVAACDPTDTVTIFNVDTIRHDFRGTLFSEASAGYLEVFFGEGDQWSFVLPEDPSCPFEGRAKAVREKKRISRLCSNGLYQFETIELFMELYAAQLSQGKGSWHERELYVAPLYQIGLRQGLVFHYVTCGAEQLDFCGVPSEFEVLLHRFGA